MTNDRDLYDPTQPDTNEKFVWCWVANVTRDPHPEGPDGEMRLGTKHFAPGAKLYCFRPAWGDGGERLRVLGRHRGGGPKLIEIVIDTKWLTNWRAQKVFQPYVVHLMKKASLACDGWDDSEQSRQLAVAMAEAWSGRRKPEGSVDGPPSHDP